MLKELQVQEILLMASINKICAQAQSKHQSQGQPMQQWEWERPVQLWQACRRKWRLSVISCIYVTGDRYC